MRASSALSVVILCALAGCTSTANLDETTPVRVSGNRPAPPPPEPPQRVEVEETRIRVDEKIHFAFDRAEIAPESDDLLREIAQVIDENPQITRIQIEGHTDAEGAAEYNQDLSERRANAVLERLIENGVAAERLLAVGFGLTRPIADNGTDDGRSQNRRVEFNILDQTGEPAPAHAAGQPRDAAGGETATTGGDEAPAPAGADEEQSVEDIEAQIAEPEEQEATHAEARVPGADEGADQ